MTIFCVTIGIVFILLAIYATVDYSHKKILRMVEIMLNIMGIILVIFIIILTVGLLIYS